MTFLRKKEWDWDVKRSVGHKTLQGSSGGEERETPAGKRHRLYMRGKSPSARLERKIPTHRYRVERQLGCAEGLEEEREKFGSCSFRSKETFSL